ncbi:winged helix DNA-binding domain-containing protein [Nocardioides sp. LS1]|uniref:winged helix DNA-binding domain-containing protein n=1 Tax=Nocardioides sp. LS1 TaxID=1027620 RepID=UPI000F617987|nr:winged helix DNA-binding domain-containing protein [Nocardioides sp. LS1]GCD88441.1 hypothetical protein NLS1_04470 [Nocardioides sp. LS1]
MRISARQLNRTLLQRQHLLERVDLEVPDLVRHLLGLQAQDPLPPYLGLHARLTTFDPYAVSRALTDRSLVRLLTMRGTIHLLTPADALSLRPWVQPALEREVRANAAIAPARDLAREAFTSAVSSVLAPRSLPVKALGEALTGHFPSVPATALAALARVAAPLVQLPPRGAWKESGGVTYQLVDRWLAAPLAPIDPSDVVRRFLAAFGPATAADVTAWSGVTGLAALVKGMSDLVVHSDENGRPLYDLPDLPLAHPDAPAPVRLLGTYDNLWLSHAARDRVTAPDPRKRWMGPNGGMAHVVLVDGKLEGLWRLVDGRVVPELFRPLTVRERSELDDEVARVEVLMAS